MNYFLAKTDPETYSIEDFEKEKTTVWNGIRSPQALRAVKAMRKGDRVLIYHSQGKAAIMGLAEVISDPRPDSEIEKSWVVDMKFIKRFSEPILLKEIKESGLFDDWNLVFQGRLSTMTVPGEFIVWLKKVKKVQL